MRDIGLIGVGYIGKRFVESLREASYSLTVYDIDESQVAYAREYGAEVADSPAGVGEASDAVFMALPGTPEVEATMEGEDGLLSTLDPGDVVVDSTTTKVETAVEYEATCEERGVHWVSDARRTGRGHPHDGRRIGRQLRSRRGTDRDR